MRTTVRTCSASHLRARLVRDRLVLVGVERLAERIDLLQAVGGERPLELLLDKLDAPRESLQVRVWLLRRREPEGQVVQGGQEVLEQPGRREEAQLLLLPHRPAAEVLEVGDGAHVAVVVRGRLLFRNRNLLGRILGCQGLPGRRSLRLPRSGGLFPFRRRGVLRFVWLGAGHEEVGNITRVSPIVQVCRKGPSGISGPSAPRP